LAAVINALLIAAAFIFNAKKCCFSIRLQKH